MNKKIIFFDVDGTLVDVRPAREYLPEKKKPARKTAAKTTKKQEKKEIYVFYVQEDLLLKSILIY